MDEVSKFNSKRWDSLVEANALFTRPWLDLDPSIAMSRMNLPEVVGDIRGKRVLCLAAGGGQQSAAFSVLGAEVSVLDISKGQLQRDEQAAKHYGLTVRVHEGDMRDLSIFADSQFDLVWQPYSLNFVPKCDAVFRHVGRILKAEGFYYFAAANPFYAGIGTKDWTGEGYLIRSPYQSGIRLSYADEDWVFKEQDCKLEIDGPIEYRHTLSDLVSGLRHNGLFVESVTETNDGDQSAAPGSWEHLKLFVPPWLSFWTRKSTK